MTCENKALTNRQKQAINTKKQILNAAQSIFEQIDYEEAKISDICALAGVSVGSFYNYFSSKEDILISTITEFDNDLADLWAKLIGEKDTSIVHKLLCIICEPARSAAKTSPFRYAQFLRVILKTHSEAYLNNMRTIDKYVKVLFYAGIEYGEIKPDIDVDDMVTSLMRTVRGILYDWTLRNGTYDLVGVTKSTALYFLSPILVSKVQEHE